VKGNLEMFPVLLGLQCEEGYQQVSSLIENHLEELRNKIKHYFPSLSTQVLRNPYSEPSAQSENLTLREGEELCELQSDQTFKMRFTDKFWISIKEEYHAIHRTAINILLQFSTSYMCKHGFSCLTSIKSKDRNHLISVQDEICVCLPKV
jgi:hypothetical protein